MLIIVGSTNPVKINAVKLIFSSIFSSIFPKEEIIVEGFQIPSGVPNQPINLEIVVKGAVNRAKNALLEGKKKFPNFFQDENKKVFSVGIEAGLVSVPYTISGYLDYQFCAILDKKNRLSIGSNSGWEYPKGVIDSIVRNRNIEIADIMGKISGDKEIKYHDGAIGYYSKGKLTRTELTQQGIRMALIPWINQEEYF